MFEINFRLVKGNLMKYYLLLLHIPPRGLASFNVRGPSRRIKTNTYVLPATIIHRLQEIQVAVNEQRLLIHLRIQRRDASL